MAISRSLMNRQLQANGGIMQVAPREKFGLGSSLKKFVRKIIPNEISEIAVKAAPFVAPFNPQIAAAMAGIGGFDQTGRIGDSLMSAGKTYAGGQAARYIGGAGFQDPSMAAFTPGGFTAGFSSPLGTSTGLGKFFSNRGTDAVQGIGTGTTGDANIAEQIASEGRANLLPGVGEGSIDVVTGGADGMGIIQDTFIDKSVVAKEPGFLKNMFDGISNQDYGKVAKTIGDGAKKFGKAMFTKPDGKGGTMIDKAAVMGAVAFAGSYAEAKALAADAGVEITPEEYDEAAKAEKKEEYASYLTNFFGGQKDGGRIGFKSGYSPGVVSAALEEYNSVYGTDSSGEEILVKDLYSGGFEEFLDIYTGDAYEKKADGGRIGYEQGANELIMEKLTEDIMPDTSTEEMIMIMTEDGPKMVKKSDFEAMSGMFRDTTTSLYGDAAKGRPVPEFANGGRIGLKFGSEPEDAEVGIMTIDVEAGDDEDQENDLMAGITFSSAEKSYLFRKLGGAGGSDRSFTMPQLYRVLSNPDRYAEDAAVLKEIALMGLGKKDGGRIGYGLGDLVRGSSMVQPVSASMSAGDTPVMPSSGMGGMLSTLINNNPQLFKNISSQNNSSDSPMPVGLGMPQSGNYADNFNMFSKINSSGGSNQIEQLLTQRNALLEKNQDVSFIDNMLQLLGYSMAAKGGRIGLKNGTGSSDRVAQLMLERDYLLSKDEDVSFIDIELERDFGIKMKAEGGIMNAKMPTGQMRKNNAGVVERDYRDEGGFVPVGIKERADDVPAMLSKNEFVMTADAVRGIGNGSVEEGSKKLYNTMKQAEKVGKA